MLGDTYNAKKMPALFIWPYCRVANNDYHCTLSYSYWRFWRSNDWDAWLQWGLLLGWECRYLHARLLHLEPLQSRGSPLTVVHDHWSDIVDHFLCHIMAEKEDGVSLMECTLEMCFIKFYPQTLIRNSRTENVISYIFQVDFSINISCLYDHYLDMQR